MSNTDTKYNPKYCDALIEFMSMGHSFSAFPGLIYEKFNKEKVHIRTLERWRDRYPEFEEAYEIGKARGLILFESFMRFHITGLMNDKIKSKQVKSMDKTCLIFTLKTRFYKEYGDQLKLQGASENAPPITITHKASDEILSLPVATKKKILEIISAHHKNNNEN